MRLVPLRSIRENTILAKTIYDDRGRVLLNQGIELSASLIDKLENNEIYAVYIQDDYSAQEIHDVISPELRQKAVKEVKQTFEKLRSDMKKRMKDLRVKDGNVKKRLAMASNMHYLNGVHEVVDDIVDEIGQNMEVMVGLVDIKSMNSFLYQHAVQVTVLSIVVGVGMQLNKAVIKELAVAAMLHDIGLSFLSDEIIRNIGFLSEEQQAEYENHCELGHEFLKENAMLSAPIRMGILQHHELYNGLGYPNGLRGDAIHLYARIIAIVDYYDMATSGDRRKIIPQSEAIEYIMGNAGEGRMFDFEIANIFVRKVVPYPIGSLVLLSNGYRAVISSINTDYPLRPIVKIIDPLRKPENFKVCNLLDTKNLNITITKTIYTDE